MIKRVSLFFLLGVLKIQAQQFPFWTNHRSNLFILNPAVAGTRKTLDVRLAYRYQWVGLEGSPKTLTFSANSRFYKGKMGAGLFVYQDKIGPSVFTALAGAYAFHIKLQDTELSFGMNGSYQIQSIDFSKMTYQFSQDNTINNLTNFYKAKVPNMAAGVLIYNPRFHVGFAFNNMLGSVYRFRPNKNVTAATTYKTVGHFNFSVGYNWAEDPSFVWENTLFANYVSGTPFLLDYNLRLHIKNALFVGAGYRIRNAVIGQIGYTFNGMAQVAYAYDFQTNGLIKTNSGTHEIKLVYVFDKAGSDKHHVNKAFLHKHFQYLL